MRKTYLMLLALMLTMGVTNAMGQKIYQAKLDKSMFTAWDGVGSGAKQTEPQSYVGKEGVTQDFACETNYYKSLGAGALVFGNSNVYSRWYANLTGTKTITFIGTAGLQLRVLMNRPDAEAGAADPNGGTSLEKNVTIGSNGEISLDVSDLEFVHLNAVKLGWGSPGGVIKKIMLEGTVKPVTGILSVINNGNAEGTDLESFPVSFDGPRNGNTANERPEVVEENGNKVFKVTAHTEPCESWHTQLYVKADEVMPNGSKWIMKMSVKASENTRITTSAQGEPRAWKGNMGIDEFGVGTEWKDFTWKGTIGVDGFQSVAFDLNNGDEEVPNTNGDGTAMVSRGITFYFDNIEFGYDLGGNDPMDDLAVEYGADVVRVKLNDMTNMKKLVGENTRIIYPNDCATVTWNGKKCSVLSVEGKNDGNLYIFLDEIEDGGSFDGDDVEVVVGFKNPADEKLHLTFTDGDWAGVDMPDFSGMTCSYNDDLAMGDEYYVSYLWGSAQLVSIDPEKGSFQLPVDTKNFTVTFNQAVVASSVKATFNKKPMTVSPSEGSAKTFTLTRAEDAAVEGQTTLVITNAVAEKSEFDLDDAIVAEYSFGPVVIDPNDTEETLLNETFADGGAGWMVNSGGTWQAANSGSGCRIISNGANANMGFTSSIVYLGSRADGVAGVALYGTQEEQKLFLSPKTYHVSISAAGWDNSSSSVRIEVYKEADIDAEGNTFGDPVLDEFKEIAVAYKTSTDAVTISKELAIEEAGNYVIKVTSGTKDGGIATWGDAIAFSNVKVEYIPNVMGLTEINAINASLEKAKEARDNASGDRYDGAAFTAIDNTIKKYDGKIGEITAPSAFAKGVEELDAATAAMNDHKALCDDYDALPEQAFNIYSSKKNTKFTAHELYAKIQSLVNKYCTVENQEVVDEEGNTVSMEVLVEHKIIKDDNELTAAKNELSSNINFANEMFTEFTVGSNPHGGFTAGIQALVERVRRGAETLKSLGVADDDPLIVAANNCITDDVELADKIKDRIKLEMYGKLKDANNDMFDVKEVGEGEEVELVTPTYDMSVFMRNPNVFCYDGMKGGAAENVPGWTAVVGGMDLFRKWDPQRNIEGLPEDCAFTTWYGNVRVESAIEDLPAGVYTVTLHGSDWANKAGNGETINGFVYCKTSDTPAVEEGAEEDRELNFAATEPIVYGGQYNMDHAHDMPEITVTDGKLIFGIQYTSDSQYFFQGASLTLTAAAEDFNYANAYNEVKEKIETGVEAPAKAAKVVRIQLFDLNGKAIPSAKKGVVFVKKTMSDGSVVVDKVLK